MSFLPRLLMAVVLLWVLSGCGYKGNLYLPGPPPAKEGEAPRTPSGK